MIPVFAASAAVVFLTRKLAARLFGQERAQLTPWIVIGSLAFIVYSTLIMFDLMITTLVLGVMLVYLSHAERPSIYKVLGAGALMGLGLMTKGPVMLLYVLLPLLFYPYWKRGTDSLPAKKIYAHLGLSVLVSLAVVSIWLVPLLTQASDNFAVSLLWKQTAGRISGNMGSSHARPFYFYFMVLPIFILPWALFPAVWRGIKASDRNNPSVRFLMAAILPAFLSFCLISGKQPHYLLPLFPFVAVWASALLHDHGKAVIRTACALIVLGLGVQSVGYYTHFSDYDLRPLAAAYNEHKERDWAFVRNYQAEIGFLGRVEKPMENVLNDELSAWFKAHPDGMAIVRYDEREDMSAYRMIYSQPYRGKSIGIFAAGKL